jgi:hypothetical protein
MNCSDLQSILRGDVDGDLLEAKVMTENEIEGTMHGLSLTCGGGRNCCISTSTRNLNVHLALMLKYSSIRTYLSQWSLTDCEAQPGQSKFPLGGCTLIILEKMVPVDLKATRCLRRNERAQSTPTGQYYK